MHRISPFRNKVFHFRCKLYFHDLISSFPLSSWTPVSKFSIDFIIIWHKKAVRKSDLFFGRNSALFMDLLCDKKGRLISCELLFIVCHTQHRNRRVTLWRVWQVRYFAQLDTKCNAHSVYESLCIVYVFFFALILVSEGLIFVTFELFF